jgi:hypothetical protein
MNAAQEIFEDADEPLGTPDFWQSDVRDELVILRTRHGHTLAVYERSWSLPCTVREPRHGELSQAERERNPWRAAVLALAAYDDGQSAPRQGADRSLSEVMLDKVLLSVCGSTLVYDIVKDAIRQPTRDEMTDAEREEAAEELHGLHAA